MFKPNQSKLRFILLVIFLLSSPVFAGINDKNFGDVMVAKVTSIYDGDTFRANIKDWPPIMGERIPVRIAGIDTPELKGKCEKEKRLGREAKQFTVTMLRPGKIIELRDIKRGKYFRLVASVFVDGKSLGDELIKAGMARPYDGGKKKGWC